MNLGGRFPDPNKLLTTNYYDHETTIRLGDFPIPGIAFFYLFRSLRKSYFPIALFGANNFGLYSMLYMYDPDLQRIQTNKINK